MEITKDTTIRELIAFWEAEKNLIVLPSPETIKPLTDSGRIIAAIQRHFPETDWAAAIAVSWLESRHDPKAHNTTGEDSRGVFQINVGPGAHPSLATMDLFNIENNVREAARIRREWGNWGPWWNAAGLLGLDR